MYLRLCALFEFVCISNPSEWNGPCSRRVPASTRRSFCVWPVGALGIDLNCFPAEALVFQVFSFPFRSFLFLSSFLFRFFFFCCCCKNPSPMRSNVLVRNVKTYENHFITGSLAGKRQQWLKSLLAVCCLFVPFYLNEYILRPYKVSEHD